MKIRKMTSLSKIIVTCLALYSLNAVASCETLENVPDVDLLNATEDLQNKISKLEEIRNNLKQNRTELVSIANDQERLLTQLKAVTLAKTAISTAMTVGGLNPVVAASSAVYTATLVANTVGFINDAINANSSKELVDSSIMLGMNNTTIVNDYATEIGLVKSTVLASTWSKLWSAVGVFEEFKGLYATLNEKVTAHDSMKAVDYQLANIDSKIATLKKGFEDTQKAVKRAENKIGQDKLDGFKQAKSALKASCEKESEKPPIKDTGLTGYTKIANDGSTLPDSVKLGTGAKDWACTRDNKTGLIWEVKTNDGGLRDQDNRYTWYNGDPATKNGYDLYCAKYPDNCQPSTSTSADGNENFIGYKGNNNQNTESYAKAVNAQGLCGSSNWRLPTKSELESLVYCSNNHTRTLDKDESGDICTESARYPRIEYMYFIGERGIIWSSSPRSEASGDGAWSVGFIYGYSYADYKDNYNGIWLVR